MDPDPAIFITDLQDAAKSVSHKYGSGSGFGYGSFHHQAKIVRKTLISTVLWLHYDILLSIAVSSIVDPDPYVFEPPGSASGSVSHKIGSGSGSGSKSFHHQPNIEEKPWLKLFCDFFMAFYQCSESGSVCFRASRFRIRISTKMSRIYNTGCVKCRVPDPSVVGS